MSRRATFEEFQRGVIRLADLESARCTKAFSLLRDEVEKMSDQQIVDRLMADQPVYGIER